MAIDIFIRNQDFKNQYYNGSDFSLNPSETRTNLAFSVMEKVKVTTDISIKWEIEYVAPGGDPANFEWQLVFNSDILTITRTDGGDFRDEGFAIGQLVKVGVFQFSLETYDFRTIVTISESEMVIDMDGVTSFSTSVAGLRITGQEPLTALIYDFGLIENLESYNSLSKVSGSNMSYYGTEIGTGAVVSRNTDFVDLINRGTKKDWISGSAKAKFLEYNQTGEENYTIQIFRIEHEFIVNPWFLDGELDNLRDGIIPDLLDGESSLKYVFNSEFRQVVSNPNIAYSYLQDDNLGSVAWFGENFNGFQSDYKIVNINFEDASAESLDGLLISGQTTVKATIEKLSGSFSSGDTIGVYVSYLPTQNQYTNTLLSNLIENFIYDSAIVDEGATAVDGSDFITDFSATVVSGNIRITFKVDYSAAQSATLADAFSDNNGNFLIGIQAGDNTISSGNSDAVINYYLGEYDQSPDISGLISLSKFGMFPIHADPDLSASYTALESWIEDGLLCEFEFDLDLSKEAFLNSLEIVCLAYNDSTGQYFELDTFPININSTVKSGVQEINTSDSRGYILNDNDPFNEVSVSNGALIGSVQRYAGRLAQKMPWQSWIRNSDVDTVFYDKDLPENGLNLRSNRYEGSNGYNVYLGLSANLTGRSDLGVQGITDYLLLSPALVVNDYDEDEGTDPIWTAEIETINPLTDANLNGGLIDGQNTLIRATWTSSNGSISDITDYFCAIRIEETNQNGFAITELSNVRDADPNQLILGSSNSLRVDVSIVGGKVVLEAIVNGLIKANGQSYNISSAIREAPSPEFSGGFDYINGFLIN